MRWRTIALLILLVLVVAYAGCDAINGWRLARTVERLEKTYGPLRLHELFPKQVKSSDNSAPFFRAAADLVAWDASQPEYSALMDLLLIPHPRDLAAQKSAKLAPLFDQNRFVFELLDAGATRPEADWGLHYEDGHQMEVPPLIKMLNVSRLVAGRVLVDGWAGRSDVAAQLLEDGLAFSRSTRNEPILIIQLVRIGMDKTLLTALRGLLARGAIGAEDLVRLEPALTRSAGDDPLRVGLRGELIMGHDFLLRAGQSSEGFSESSLTTQLVSRLARPLVRVDDRVLLETIGELLRRHSTPRPLDSVASADVKMPWTILGYARQFDPDRPHNLVLSDAATARWALARTAVALERRRLDGKSCPADLSELVPDYLSELPQDPFTGRPLEYSCAGGQIALRSAGEEQARKAMARGIGDPLLRWTLPAAPAASEGAAR